MADVVYGARTLDPPLGGSVVTLGSFDGVHRGHQALIARAVEAARRLEVPAIGFTFYPHPATVLAPHLAPPTLLSIEKRAAAMLAAGLDKVLVETFDEAFSQVSADDFITRYLVEPLSPRHIVVGFNFFYGRGRGGDAAHLRRAGEQHGFEVEVVEPVSVGPIVASSTRVREYLLNGNLVAANELLGRPFILSGTVVEGEKRGRTIGFPTANLQPDANLLPAHGVYATRVTVDSETHDAVTNIGTRPTFDGVTPTVESFLLDWSGDLYGKPLDVALIRYLRPERRFDGIDALKAQLDRDVEAARAALST